MNTTMPKITIRNGLVENPGIDLFISGLIAIGLISFIPLDRLHYLITIDFLIGLSTLSGLVMAAATFICSMLYQSDHPLCKEARKRYGTTLSKNWIGIISYLIIYALVPLLAPVSPTRRVCLFLSIFACVGIIGEFIRIRYWLKAVLLFYNKG